MMMFLIDFLKFGILPGVLYVVWFSIVLSWFLRKMVARLENRVGPPFNQPAYDITKLMAKQRVYPRESNRWILHYIPRAQLAIALLMSFFIPVINYKGLLSFSGDLYFFLFLLALHGSTAFFVGWASKNTYTLSGAGRAVLTEISFEIPLAISLAGMSIMTGQIRISEMCRHIWGELFNTSNDAFSWVNLFYLIPWMILLITSLYSVIGALELNPFSAAHAETEIVGGWTTELTGSDLAMTKFADIINLFNLGGLIVAIFLGGPLVIATSSSFSFLSLVIISVALIVFMIKMLFVVFIISFIVTLSSRLRIDQITSMLWSIFLPASMLSILLVISIQALGG